METSKIFGTEHRHTVLAITPVTTRKSDVTALVNITPPTLVVYGGGPAYQSTITVPAGYRYCVVAEMQADQTACNNNLYSWLFNYYGQTNNNSSCYVYPGKRTYNRYGHNNFGDEDDYGDDDGDTDPVFVDGASKSIFIQVLQDANGHIRPCNTDGIPGSLLLISSPNYIDFTDTTALLPIVYESVEGEWNVNVSATPPDGFYTLPDTTLTIDVLDSNLLTCQYTVVDTGSDWTSTKVTTQLRHNGRDITHTVNPAMLNHKWTSNYLGQNFPNPFDQQTAIPYNLPQASRVKLSVYDMYGREVSVLVNNLEQKAGYYEPVWNGCDNSSCDLPSGMYLARLQVTSLVKNKVVVNTKRMLLLK